MNIVSRALWPEIDRAMGVCLLHQTIDGYEVGWESCKSIKNLFDIVQQHRANVSGDSSPPEQADEKGSIETLAKRYGK